MKDMFLFSGSGMFFLVCCSQLFIASEQEPRFPHNCLVQSLLPSETIQSLRPSETLQARPSSSVLNIFIFQAPTENLLNFGHAMVFLTQSSKNLLQSIPNRTQTTYSHVSQPYPTSSTIFYLCFRVAIIVTTHHNQKQRVGKKGFSPTVLHCPSLSITEEGHIRNSNWAGTWRQRPWKLCFLAGSSWFAQPAFLQNQRYTRKITRKFWTTYSLIL